jgi:hypothetical protein
LCALSGAARIKQHQRTQAKAKVQDQAQAKEWPGGNMYAETAAIACQNALGLNVSTLGADSILHVKLDTFRTAFENAMQNPEPVEDPKFVGGTQGACLAMIAMADFDEGDAENVENFGSAYVDAIIDYALNGEAPPSTRIKEFGVQALGKLGPFLNDEYKMKAMSALIPILADVNDDDRPVIETGLAIGRIFPATGIGWILATLKSAMMEAATHARAKNNYGEMQGVAHAMRGCAARPRSEVQDIIRIMKAADVDGYRLRKHEHNYLGDVYKEVIAIWPAPP